MRSVVDGKLLCRTCFDLTLYFRTAPLAADVITAWQAYRRVCPPQNRAFIKTTEMTFLWDRLPEPDRMESLVPYLRGQDERLDHGIAFRDEDLQEGWSFNIEGVFPADVDATDCASFCQVLFPAGTTAETVLELALQLSDGLDFLSGHAGYSCVFDPWRKFSAFDTIYAWAKRYWGLDVQEIYLTLPVVLDHIKGANWLTLIGNEFWDRLSGPDGREPRFGSKISVTRASRGRVIRAGPLPVMADRNRREFPLEYAEVEAALWPLKLGEHPEFPGRFSVEEATMSWFRRLVEPKRW